ncbi:ATP-binding protein [Paraburkholderia sp. J8-2]|uniref:ATP-binding protein n=1 Tax=Paraburkholderia sp. J8-2 TaxID=2805440 RepID=UPI002AB7A8C7|nr:ATP-binding protein [Paraburkholderia sp. J8-2]
MQERKIRPRDRDAVLQALRAGVVPGTGQYLIQVGRAREVQALIADAERIVRGGTAFRVVVGEYGSGKTFFLRLVRALAHEMSLVTAYADLNPDRRIYATGGQARSLFAELMKNLATRSKPEGGALAAVLERFIASAIEDARKSGEAPETLIMRKCAHLTEMVNGYDFATVLAAYWRGHNEGNETLKLDAIRWFRGEFTTRTDARQALGVRTIVDDATVYDQIKLMAAFVRLAGYDGMLVALDEVVNLYKLANPAARNANYEQILRILNDVLQGTVEGLGFIMGCTPDSLFDTRRGIYSYAALQSRLAENTFAKGGLIDYQHPVLHLSALTREDLYMLLENIRRVYALGDPSKYLLPDDGIQAFMHHCEKRVGESYFRTPRTTITAFINLLSVLEQYPETPWTAMIEKLVVEKDEGGAAELEIIGETTEGEGFAGFQL